MGGGGSGGGGGGGLDQLLAMIGGGGGGKSGGGQQGGTSDHNAGKSNWEKMDAFGNIADGNKDLRPAEHAEYGGDAPAPLQQMPQQAQAMPGGAQTPPRTAPTVPTNQQLNNSQPMMGYNDAQGQALDDYAAEELARRQRSMDIA